MRMCVLAHCLNLPDDDCRQFGLFEWLFDLEYEWRRLPRRFGLEYLEREFVGIVQTIVDLCSTRT
jgi:hypothetical protein